MLATGYFIPGLLMVSTIFFDFLSGFLGHLVIRKNMRYARDKFGSSFSYGLMMVLIMFVVAYNNLSSIFIKKIKWGGRIYHKPSKSS